MPAIPLKATLKKMGYTKYPFDPKELRMGLKVELEHKDITGGDPVMTMKITLAHLKENPKYYTILKSVGL